MTEPLFAWALLQPQPLRTTSNAVSFVTTTLIVLVVVIIALYFVFKTLRKQRDLSVAAQLQAEFEKGKEALLLKAQEKKAAHQEDEKARREVERAKSELELLKENIDPARVLGQTCPLSGLEMMADQELVIDAYTGQGYHFSSFLNDWPPDTKRPEYVYRYPQGTVVKTSEMLKSF